MYPKAAISVRLLYGLGSVLAGLVAMGCERGVTAASPRDLHHSHTNVLLLTFCTLRADHLGCYGYERETSPNIDQLAREGVMFRNTLTQVPWTRASVGAMITGLYPRSLNLHDPVSKQEGRILHDQFETLAERFQAAGYHTIGITGNAMLNEEFGFRQGYDSWSDTGTGWKKVKRQGVPRAAELNKLLFEKIAEAGGQKFFAHVTYVDAHDPRKEFYDLQDAPPFSVAKPPSPTDLYDLRLRYADEQFGALRARLESLGLRDTLIIINGDHGEGLREGRVDDHGHGGRLYNSAIWVPWIMYHPGLAPRDHAPTTLVQVVDQTPTLLEVLGMSFERDRLGGVSRRGLINGDTSNEIPFSVVETQFKHADKSAIVTDTWKLIAEYCGGIETRQPLAEPQFELYRYREDRLEENNVLNENQEVFEQLSAKLAEWQAGHPPLVESDQLHAHVRSATRQELVDIGYVGTDDNQPNVVLITVNGLRRDHLGCYGYYRPTSPAIDALAKEAMIFEHCITPAIKTLPAHRALMTGRYSPDSSLPTLAETVRELGMRTAAFSSLPALDDDPKLGMANGFQAYDAPRRKRRPAIKTNQSAISWLAKNGADPFFLWVQYSDLFSKDDELRGLTDVLANDTALEAWAADHDRAWESGGDNANLLERINLYDCNLRYVDTRIGELLEFLQARGLLENTVVVLTADHGISFDTSDHTAEPLLSQEGIAIPLLIRLPEGDDRKTERIDRVVSSVDVAPTVLSSLGVPANDEGVDEWTGVNLLADALDSRPAFSAACPTDGSTSSSCSRSVITWPWKLVRTVEGSERLLDLEADPLEQRNVIEEHAEVADQLRASLQQLENPPVAASSDVRQNPAAKLDSQGQ